MILRSFRGYFLVFVTLLLISCGGGSTVTSASLTSEDGNYNLSKGARTILVASAQTSVTGNTLGEKVAFSLRHNESGATLDVINDRLDGSGLAKAYFIAGPKDGVDIVEASFESGARATVTIYVGAVNIVGNIRLEAFSDSGVGVGPSAAWRIRATVTDTSGMPLVGVNVNFSTNNGSLSAAPTTNEAGQTETILSGLPHNQGARVWATAGGISVSIQVGGRGPDEDVRSIRLEALGNNIIRATVLGVGNQPLPGKVVNFSTNIGELTTPGATDANGMTTVTWSAPPGTTSARITATSEGVTESITVQYDADIPRVHSIRLEAFGNNIIRATVLGVGNQPLPGKVVNFSTNIGELTAPDATDANGMTTATWSAPPGTTSARITATSEGVTTTLNVTFDDPERPRISSIRLEQFSTQVRATVQDAAGRPVPNVEVNFGISEGTIAATGTTNVNGIAEAGVTNLNPGDTATVTARVDNVSRTLTYIQP
ncbi:Ig-like domain (group 1) [Desulfonatronum zhilinae]|nr:Ig-like domain (group 1) [Desulfonatronum zhilinae]